MKRPFVFLILLLIVCSANAGSKTPAQKLIKRMHRLQKSGIMIGHQDDAVYGKSWKWDLGKSDVKDVCGDYPAVMGFDLGAIELGSDKNLDKVPFDRIRKEIIMHYMRGGIITLSWHPWNPVTGKNAWDNRGHAVNKLLKEKKLNSTFNNWLNSVATFIKSLKTDDGQAIPVIFRPWHEMSGDWFWWGTKSCTPQEYIEFYRYTHDKIEALGCNNVVWAYSPNIGVDDYMKFYPGNDYVDLLGIDIYEFDKDNSKYVENVKKSFDELTVIGKQNKKLVALTETGCQAIPYADWFTTTFLPSVKPYNISYVLFWRNAWDSEKELYMSAPGHATADDFKKLYKDKKTLFLNDIKHTK